MKSEIILVSNQQPIAIKESYETIKRRLRDESYFIELTDKRGKVTISKVSIMMVASLISKKIKKVNKLVL
jgi:hypothetical protein